MDIAKVKLVNLSSGAPVDDAIVEILVFHNGNIQAELFQKESFVTKTSLFFDPVKHCRFANFKVTSKSASLRKDNKSFKVNHSIMGALLAYSVKSGKVIDLEKALVYFLSQITLSILNGDGTCHVT